MAFIHPTQRLLGPLAGVTVVCTKSDVYQNDTSGLAATTAQGAIDELAATKANAADQTSMLLQNQGSVADVSDPNDTAASPDVTCSSAIPGKCMFINTQGHNFVNVTATRWRRIGPPPLLDFQASRSVANANVADSCINWGNSQGWPPSPFGGKLGVVTSACSSNATQLTVLEPFTITRITLTHSLFSANVADSGIAISGGCAVCITTDGSTCEAGTRVDIPSSSGGDQLLAGVSSSTDMTYVPDPLVDFQLLYLLGDFNFSGTARTCQFGQAGTKNRLTIEGFIN